MGSGVPLASLFAPQETVQRSSVVKNSSTVSLNDAYFRVHFLFSINYARRWFPNFRRKFPKTMDPKVSRYIRLLQCAHTSSRGRKWECPRCAKCVKATSPFPPSMVALGPWCILVPNPIPPADMDRSFPNTANGCNSTGDAKTANPVAESSTKVTQISSK
jgi:hypothetical protein